MYLKSDKELKISYPEYELLVPVNNKEIGIKAIDAGADAIYIGYLKYGARAQAGNSIEDIIDIVNYAHQYNVKVYVTINTILNNKELKEVEKLIQKLYEIKIDGIIIQDMGILELKLPPIEIIASTQCNNNTLDKINFLESTGFKRVILPREISLEEIRNIRKNTNIELECFIHGALCMSYSGQCYLSYVNGGRSANRGECAQPCRKIYTLKDNDGKVILKDKYILSLKDLNLSEYLEELIKAGITSFKIEGRLKNISYIINTTAFYRKKLDSILNKLKLKRSSDGISEYNFEPNPNKTFNRGFTEYYINKEKKDIATINYSSSLGEYIGTVKSTGKNYFLTDTNILKNGDGICFFTKSNKLQGTYINRTEKNKVFPLEMKEIKEGLKIYRNYNKEFDDTLQTNEIRRKISTKLRICENTTNYIFFLSDEKGNTAAYITENKFEPAHNKEKAIQTLITQLEKSGNTEFKITNTEIKINDIPFIKISKINEIRRILTIKLRQIRKKNYNYQTRKYNIELKKYPTKMLNYKANIYNDKAKEFYEKRGCNIIEYALESTYDQKTLTKKEIMISKYCIKNQIGLCSKYNKSKSENITGNCSSTSCCEKKYKEPYILKDEFNKEYLVEFDCKDCVMKISIMD